jgi:hypothetical protein
MRNLLTYKHFLLIGLFFAGLLPQVTAQRLGLHVTQPELNIWKTRAAGTLTSGTTNYRATGDVSANSPGDWNRIKANADAFKANPSAERYLPYPTTTTCIPQAFTGEPDHKGQKLRDAAFAYLVTGDVTYRDAVRTELLAQAAEPATDFSNTARWCSNVIRDVNPGFMIAAWMSRMLFAYDYIRPTLSATDKGKLDKWFYHAALYYQARNVDVDLQKIWVNRYNGLYEPITNSNGTTAYDIDKGALTTHYGGATFANLSLWHNNRRGVMTSFFTSVGVMLGEENNVSPAEVGLTAADLSARIALFRERGKLFVKEWLMFSVRPDGTMAEMERWESTQPEQGWQYALILLDHVLVIADHLARAGDLELYNYTTSAGKYGTEGGPKTLQATATHMLKYVDRTLNRYATDQAARSTDNNYRIDAISPLEGKHYVFDTWMAQSNLYWKNAYLKSIYTRQATGTSAYPSAPTGSGQYNAWTGGFGTFPGKLFMFGQLENVVDPYNAAPVVSLTAPATGKSYLAGAGATLAATATDGSGTISKVEFFNGAAKLGEDLTSPYSFTWHNLAPGTYSLTAKATDNAGLTTTSAPVSITVAQASTGTDRTNEAGAVITVSGEFTGGEQRDKAFDNLSETKWCDCKDVASPTWIQYQFGGGQAYAITEYTITSANNLTERDPKGWTLKGSHDGITFTTLDTRSNEVFADRFQKRLFSFANGTAYQYYRFDFTSNGSPSLQLAEIELYGNATTLYRAINLNGAALTIDGNNWEASSSAAAFSATGFTFSNQSVVLNPATDANRATMIRSSIYATASAPATLTLSSVPNGTYDVYLYTWEDNGSITFDINLEGNLVADNYVSGPAGTWAKLGPWRTTISDGTLVLTASNGAGTLSGLEVHKVPAGSSRLATAATPEPAMELPAAYPNPFSDRLRVALGKSRTGTISVALVDLLGNVYYQQEKAVSKEETAVTLELAGQSLKPGVYLLRVQDGHGATRTVKLVKR